MAAQQFVRATAGAGGHLETVTRDTAVEQVTGIELAWLA
jgi:hypothetical protein